MTLFTAVDIGKSIGLRTVMESYWNINIHAASLFAYEYIGREMAELRENTITVLKAMGEKTDVTIEEYENFIKEYRDVMGKLEC